MVPDFQHLWDNMVVTNDQLVIDAANLILKHTDRYKQVVEGTSIPWQFVGTTHYREADCDFTCHPHNGDPLTHRTVNVPAQRPVTGTPPFTWEESAKDCYITYKKLGAILHWDIPMILDELERFNGLGYRKYHPDILSPYLWSGTSYYHIGKYARDGKFDPNLKDKQAGCAPIYLYLTDKTKIQS